MGLSASPPAPAVSPIPDAIAGDGWYPALSIAAFKVAQRLPSVVTDQRAREALLGGVLSADAELARWRDRQRGNGALSLAGVVLRDRAGQVLGEIGGEPRALVLWRRAVYAFAAADLVETHGDISATADARARNEERAARGPDLLRTATLAIRDLVGTSRTRVRLL